MEADQARESQDQDFQLALSITKALDVPTLGSALTIFLERVDWLPQHPPQGNPDIFPPYPNPIETP